MSLRLNGSTSGYSELEAPAVAGDQTFTLPGTGGTLDRLNRQWNIVKVVTGSTSAAASSSSSTLADTGLSASITPDSASNKIIVIVAQAGCRKTTNNTGMKLVLLRDATQIVQIEANAGNNAAATTNYIGTITSCYIDSPSTTSLVTYKTQFASSANLAAARVQSDGVETSLITLIEVAG
jgi:hypothetical protein